MDVEGYLTRFCPAGPPPRLREQVLEACRPKRRSLRRLWPFAGLAAAMVLIVHANFAIEERLAARLPAAEREAPSDAAQELRQGPGALSLSPLLGADTGRAHPQNAIRLRLQLQRSGS